MRWTTALDTLYRLSNRLYNYRAWLQHYRVYVAGSNWEWQLLRCAVPHLCALASRIMAAYCDIASLGVFGHFIGYLNFLCSVFLY